MVDYTNKKARFEMFLFRLSRFVDSSIQEALEACLWTAPLETEMGQESMGQAISILSLVCLFQLYNTNKLIMSL